MSRIDINTAQIGFDIDITPIVSALNKIYSSAQAIDPSTRAGKKLWSATTEKVASGISEALHQEALKRQTAIAHVFDWESVVDHTPTDFRMNTKLGKRQRRDRGGVGRKRTAPESSMATYYTDSTAKFIPKIRPKSPLFRLNLVDNGDIKVAEVVFQAPSITDYDPIVRARSRTQGRSKKTGQFLRNAKFGRHHFADQATNLEQVSNIQKQSNPSSSRRLSGSDPGKGRQGRRVIQAFVSGSQVDLQFFGTYVRDNPYTGQFSRFFLQFASSKADQNAQKTLNIIQKDILKVYSHHVDEVVKRHAASMMKVSAGAMVGGSGRARVAPLRIIVNGRPVKTIPQLNDKDSERIMQDVLAQFRKVAGQDELDLSGMEWQKL